MDIIRIPAAIVAADVVDEYIADYLAGELCLPLADPR